jgi:hypothetical protein
MSCPWAIARSSMRSMRAGYPPIGYGDVSEFARTTLRTGWNLIVSVYWARMAKDHLAEMARDFRSQAERLTRAADALDPPTRKKPGPKPGSRRKQQQKGAPESPAPTVRGNADGDKDKLDLTRTPT